MGENNRVWVHDIEYDDSCDWTFRPDSYLGGELKYDVNLSDTPCECAFGAHLAYLDD
jgi:hypothetical protein